MQQSKASLQLNRLFLSCTLFLGASPVVLSAPQQLDFPEAGQLQRLNSTSAARARLGSDESFNYRKKSITVSDLANSFKNRIEIKFSDNSDIRLRQGHLVVLKAVDENNTAASELKQLENILQVSDRYTFTRMHELSEEELDAMKKGGEKNTGQTLPDLNLWFYIFVDTASDQELALIINRLNQLDIVEYASPSALPASSPGMTTESIVEFDQYWRQHNKAAWPGAQKKPPTSGSRPRSLMPGTPMPPSLPTLQSPPPPLAASYVANQDYREAAPVGININYVNSRYFSADGWNWGYTDVEGSWNTTHGDLGQIAGDVYANGMPSFAIMENPPFTTFQQFHDHGTAVIGILSSDDNGFGTTGLVPSAAVRLSTHSPATGYNPASAITAAANQFWKGAVILLEMQTGAGFDCSAGTMPKEQWLVPIEWHPASKAAIKTAVANGRIVVEAAGNGNCDLDLAGFKGAFNPAELTKDSGAIIVGAGDKLTRNKSWFSTYGSRVDTHAEGDSKIYTTGYGDEYNSEGENLWYTTRAASAALPALRR